MKSQETPASSLTGMLLIENVHFDTPELAWFAKAIWSRWTPAQREVNQVIRLAVEDLSMATVLKVDYEIQAETKNQVECLYVSTQGDNNRFLQISITNSPRLQATWPGSSAPLSDNVWPMVHQWARDNAGKVFGSASQVEFETILFKLRQLLTGVQSHVIGRAQYTRGGLEIGLQLQDVNDRMWWCVIHIAHPLPALAFAEAQEVAEQPAPAANQPDLGYFDISQATACYRPQDAGDLRIWMLMDDTKQGGGWIEGVPVERTELGWKILGSRLSVENFPEGHVYPLQALEPTQATGT